MCPRTRPRRCSGRPAGPASRAGQPAQPACPARAGHPRCLTACSGCWRRRARRPTPPLSPPSPPNRPWPLSALAGGPEQARTRQSDSNDLDASGCGPCWLGPVPSGRPNQVRVTRLLQRVGKAPDMEITSYTKIYLANWPSIRDTPTPAMQRRPRPGPGSRPLAARVCAVSKAGAVPRRPMATRHYKTFHQMSATSFSSLMFRSFIMVCLTLDDAQVRQ